MRRNKKEAERENKRRAVGKFRKWKKGKLGKS